MNQKHPLIKGSYLKPSAELRQFKLLNEQVHRINAFVGKLLQFARPEEFAGNVVVYSLNDVVKDSLPLVRHLFDKAKIELTLALSATRLVAMNKTELQQVLKNFDGQRHPRDAKWRRAENRVL